MSGCLAGAATKPPAGFLVREDLCREIEILREAIGGLRDKLAPISANNKPESPGVCSEGPAESEYFSSIYRAATTISFLAADIHRICDEVEL